MSIYFQGRELSDPIYKNNDYLNQQAQFINILRAKTSHFSIKAGELKLTKKGAPIHAIGFLHIDLNNVQRVTVCIPSLTSNFSLHELFKIWNKDRKGEIHHLTSELQCSNIMEFLGVCHDILTVKFQNEWKLVI